MIISWNYKGAASDKFIATYRDLRSKYHPQVMILLETWVSGVKADEVIKNWGLATM